MDEEPDPRFELDDTGLLNVRGAVMVRGLSDRLADGARTTGDDGSENDGVRDDERLPNEPDREELGDLWMLIGWRENEGDAEN